MRRTKEDSAQTRRLIIEAARDVFARQGVSRTSLEQVAQAAGVTRGAIYWHFANKTELFYAMREQVALPMIDRTDPATWQADEGDPLACVQHFLLGILQALENDAATRSTFDIMAFRCEYVGELEAELDRHSERHAEIVVKLTALYQRAEGAGELRKGLEPGLAALETLAFLIGLVRLWLLDEKPRLMRDRASELIGAHVANQRRHETGSGARS